MQLYLIFAVLCLRQLVIAQKRSHTDGVVNYSEERSGARQLWTKLEAPDLREASNEIFRQQTMTGARVDSGAGVWRALDTTSGCSVQTRSLGHSEVGETVSSLKPLATWRRKLGDRNLSYSAPSENSEYEDARGEEPEKTDADTLFWLDVNLEKQSASAWRAAGPEEAEHQERISASHTGNSMQKADEDSSIRLYSEKLAVSNGASEVKLFDKANSLEAVGGQPQRSHGEMDTRGNLHGSAKQSSEGAQEVEAGRACTGENESCDAGIAVAAERSRSSLTAGETQSVSEAEENPEDAEGQDPASSGVGKLRTLGKRKNYVSTQPVKLPSPPPLPAPKSKRLPLPPTPTKIGEQRGPVPLSKNVLTFKRSLVPPTKVHKIHKISPPLKVIRPKKIVPPPKKHVIPKKVVHSKKKFYSEKKHTKYIPARKKFLPQPTYVPAPTKFVPTAVYVPAPKKV